jgi:AcrR family transcriptional regulator
MDATVELLREVTYSSVTMRSIAKRAGVAHREVLTHFRSKDAIVAEVYLKRLRAAPLILDVEQSAQERIAAQFSQLVMLLADQPGLTAACSSALICDEPSMRSIRQRIHAELHRRVRTTLRSGGWPEVAETLEYGLIGALVHAAAAATGSVRRPTSWPAWCPLCCPTAARRVSRKNRAADYSPPSRRRADT